MSPTKWPTDTCACGKTKMARSATCRACFTKWPERFWAKVEKTGACWLWTAQTDNQGYGIVSFGGRSRKAHRVAWLMKVGPLPDDLTIDHLCRVRRCVNPTHLEPVTNSENVLRGEGIMVRNSRKTHCIRGHEFTPENTRVDAKGRTCRSCQRLHTAAYRERHR